MQTCVAGSTAVMVWQPKLSSFLFNGLVVALMA